MKIIPDRTLPMGAFTEFVGNAQRRMFRLETRDDYPDDYEMMARWYTGESVETSILDCQWSKNLRAMTDRGVDCTRVHVVPEPLTEYLRFEVFGYYPISSSQLGERIFILPEERITADLLFWGSRTDFLLVDDTLLVHEYDPDTGLFSSTGIVHSSDLLRTASDEAQYLLSLAIPLANFQP